MERFKLPCTLSALPSCHKSTNTSCTKEKYVKKGKILVVLSLWWVEQDRCYLPSPDLLLHCFQGILAILATKMKSHIFANKIRYTLYDLLLLVRTNDIWPWQE